MGKATLAPPALAATSRPSRGYTSTLKAVEGFFGVGAIGALERYPQTMRAVAYWLGGIHTLDRKVVGVMMTPDVRGKSMVGRMTTQFGCDTMGIQCQQGLKRLA
ncbi:MAG: hypothetical protein ABSH05_25405 [Bryobacteraceae bacterium]|jgi:hypothetical protein